MKAYVCELESYWLHISLSLSLSEQLDFINFIKFCFQLLLFLIYAKFVVSKKLKISLHLRLLLRIKKN